MQHTDQCQYVVNTIIQFKIFVISQLAQQLLDFKRDTAQRTLKLVLYWAYLFQEIKQYQQLQRVTKLTAQMSEMLINGENKIK